MDGYGRPLGAAPQAVQYGAPSQPMPGMQAPPIQGMPPAAAPGSLAYPGAAGSYPQGAGAGVTPQYQQLQAPQQVQQQIIQQPSQAGPAVASASEQPGFFRRLFGKGGENADGTVLVASGEAAEEPGLLGRLCTPTKKTEPVAQQGAEQQAGEAESARCLPSKPLAAEAVAALRGRLLPLSKLPFLNAANAQSPMYTAVPAASMQPTETPGILGPPPQVSKYGPYLRFGGYDPVSRQWRGSVMVVVHQARCATPPILRFRDVHVRGAETEVPGQHLSHYQGWNFWRCNIVIECGMDQRTIEYMVVLPSDHAFTHHTRYTFVVAGIHQKWRWGFYSCNGSHDVTYEQSTGIQALWKDVMFCHQQSPFHVMLGGGDQLYNDPVWQCPALEAWTTISSTEARCTHPFTQDMVNQVFNFYFCNYIRKWAEPVFADALATIPQMMVWDDHDIWDGWGSYPEHLQACPVFQGVYYIAREFYALFQQHTTVARAAHDNGVWGAGGWHCLTCLGASTAVLVLDTRAERTPHQIIHPTSWQMIYGQLSALPSSIRHVVVLATVPVIYPQIPVVESALQFLAGDGRSRWGILQMMQKTGLADSLISQFGTVEIMDDLVDHWGAEVHADEKLGLVQMMQALSLAYGYRFTLLSGDVHCAAVGRFSSFPVGNLKTDHRYVPQIISSAIGNYPPPDGVVKALTACAKPKQILPDTRECMVNVFGVQKVVYAARNWLQVSEQPYMPGAMGADGSLHFQFHVENPNLRHARPEMYYVVVPPLELPASGRLQLPPLPHPTTCTHVPLQPVQASMAGPYPAQYNMPSGYGVPSQTTAPMQVAQQPYPGHATSSYPAVAAAGTTTYGSSTAPAGTAPAVGQSAQPAYAQGLAASTGVAGPSNPMPLPPASYADDRPATPTPAPYADGRPALPTPGSPAWLLNQSATPGTFMPPSTPSSNLPPAAALQQSSSGGAQGPAQTQYPTVMSSGQAATQQYGTPAAQQDHAANMAAYPGIAGYTSQPTAGVVQGQLITPPSLGAQQQQAAPTAGAGQYGPAAFQQQYATPAAPYPAPGAMPAAPTAYMGMTSPAVPTAQQTGPVQQPQPYYQAHPSPYAQVPQQSYVQQPAQLQYAQPQQQQQAPASISPIPGAPGSASPAFMQAPAMSGYPALMQPGLSPR